MKNADMPAMPIEIDGFGQYKPEAHTGMTKREYAAIKIMASLAIKSADYGVFDGMARDAVAMADAVLEELENSK